MKRLESARRNRIQQLKESAINTNSSHTDDMVNLEQSLPNVESKSNLRKEGSLTKIGENKAATGFGFDLDPILIVTHQETQPRPF